MLKSETAKLLAKAALVDNRNIDRLTIEAWHEIVGHLDYHDAIEALTRHRATSTDYLVPAHIVQGVQAIQAERRAAARREIPADSVPDADPDNIPAYLQAVREGRMRPLDTGPLRPIPQLVTQTAQTLQLTKD